MVNWYVLHSKPRKEAFLYKQLLNNRIEAYLPSIRIEPVNPRARKEQPFFPGYLFIHVDLRNISPSDLKWMPGAVGLVCYGGEPAHVPDRLVREIQTQVDEFRSESWNLRHFKPGDLVVIKDGPFAEYQAIFDRRLSAQDRVQVLLELLKGKKIRLELSASQLTHLKRQ